MKKSLSLALVMFMVCVGPSVAQTQLQPSFNHLALNAYDLQKTGDFYEKVLYLKKIDDPFKDGKHIWFHMGTHNQLHVIAGGAKEQHHPKDIHLAFTVSSVEEFVEHLKKENIPFASGNSSGKVPTLRADGVKQVFFQDPDGFWIEVNNDAY